MARLPRPSQCQVLSRYSACPSSPARRHPPAPPTPTGCSSGYPGTPLPQRCGCRRNPVRLPLRYSRGSAAEPNCSAPEPECLPQFDCDVGVWLAQNDLIFDGAALRDEFWSFVGIVVASNVVLWRFGTSRERYLGGVRNTFQRLWLRARVLDRGAGSENRWQLLNDLTEDALVQIMERPSIGADPLLARSLAEAWVGAAVRFRKSKMEGVMRRATLRVRVQNEIRSLASLDSYSLASILDALFDAAADDSAGSANGSALSNVHGTVPSSSIPEEDKMLYEQPKGEIRPFPNTATRP